MSFRRAFGWFSLRSTARLATGLTTAVLLLLLLLRVSLAQDGTATPVPTVARLPVVTPAPATTNFYLLTRPHSANDALSGLAALNLVAMPPQIHVVQPGETLMAISARYGVSVARLAEINRIAAPDRIETGQTIIIAADPALLSPLPALPPGLAPLSATMEAGFTDIVSRLTPAAQNASVASPYYRTTWVSTYGRPGVAPLGIVGQYTIPALTELLKQKAEVIDAANGSRLRVKPAYHLLYGMAVMTPTAEGDHLEYLPDATVMAYVNAGLRENIAVVLDVQVGALPLSEAIAPALGFLKYPNVHLAIDPTFAISHPNQSVPGDPVGFVTGEQINELQTQIAGYLEQNRIRGKRILLVHQVHEEMLTGKDDIDWENPRLELTICADGWGEPPGKIWKYNTFFGGRSDVKFTALKLFQQWDDPLLTARQALGVDRYRYDSFIDVTPNMIIYQ